MDVCALIIGTYTGSLPHVTGTAGGLLGAPPVRAHQDRRGGGAQGVACRRSRRTTPVFALDDPAEPAPVVACGGRTPRDMVFTPDGAHLLVANQDSNSLALFAIGSSLSPVWTRPVPSPVCVRVAR